jgi:uncharacterized protein YbcI
MAFGTQPASVTIKLKLPNHPFPVFCGNIAGIASSKINLGILVSCERHMKTQGEIEAAVCEGIARFEQEYMGRGPKDIRAYLIGDLLVVRLKGVLTVAEQQLVASLPAEKGRDLLKQVRIHLVETARPVMETMIQEITGAKVVSLHHDISTVTGEEVVLFTLANLPAFREGRN